MTPLNSSTIITSESERVRVLLLLLLTTARSPSFAAELLVGLWRTYSSLDPTISPSGITHLPSPSRMILPHVQAGKWNDYAKMNSFLSRAIFPSMSYEYQNDFLDRADTHRAFLFERIVFTDRAAAFRGDQFQKTWRTASEAMTLAASRYWWAPIRKNLIEFVGGGMGEIEMLGDVGLGVGVEQDYTPSELDVVALEQEEGALREEKEELLEESRKEKQAHSGKPVITYVSRQEWGRRMLIKEDHDELVRELNELEKKYGWEVNVVSMDQLSRDEQIRLAARTTVCSFDSRETSEKATDHNVVVDHAWRSRQWAHSPSLDELSKP